MGGRTWVRVGISTFMLLALSAFGGGGGAGDFRDDADEICLDSVKQQEEVRAEVGPPQSLEEDAALTEELLPIREEALAQLEELEPPAKLQDDYEEFLRVYEERNANDEAFLEAAAAGDQATIDSLSSEFIALRDERRAIAGELGFKECADRMSKKEEKKVRALVEETFTEGDPEFCTEKYTEAFVESIGGPEACEEAENDPANVSESIDIEDVFGVDKIYATVRLVPEGGPAPEEPIEVDHVYEDGVYKRDAIFAA